MGVVVGVCVRARVHVCCVLHKNRNPILVRAPLRLPKWHASPKAHLCYEKLSRPASEQQPSGGPPAI